MSAVYRVVWLAIIAALFAFSAQTFFASTLAASEEELAKQVIVRDAYRDGAHHFSGMVMVPSSCHDLTVRARDIDAATMALIFETWRQPYRTSCTEAPTPRAFEVSTFAPRTVDVKGLLDGEVVPLSIIMKEST